MLRRFLLLLRHGLVGCMLQWLLHELRPHHAHAAHTVTCSLQAEQAAEL